MGERGRDTIAIAIAIDRSIDRSIYTSLSLCVCVQYSMQRERGRGREKEANRAGGKEKRQERGGGGRRRWKQMPTRKAIQNPNYTTTLYTTYACSAHHYHKSHLEAFRGRHSTTATHQV